MGMICIPIMAGDTGLALKLMDRASIEADLMEIRLDVMTSFDLEAIISHAKKPVIVTYRSKEQGGLGTATHEVCARHLRHAADLGADYVDVEFSMPRIYQEEIFKSKGKSRIILSAHIPDQTPAPAELESQFQRMAGTHPDIIKLVTFARTFDDNLNVLGLIPLAKKMRVEIITFCMGEPGKISRIFCLLLGGFLSFASLEPGRESASGQIPVKDMKNMLQMFAASQTGIES